MKIDDHYIPIGILAKRLGLADSAIVRACIDGYAPIYFKIPEEKLEDEFRQIKPEEADAIEDSYIQYDNEQQFDFSTDALILGESDREFIFRKQLKEARQNGESADPKSYNFIYCIERMPTEAFYIHTRDIPRFELPEAKQKYAPLQAELSPVKLPENTEWKSLIFDFLSESKMKISTTDNQWQTIVPFSDLGFITENSTTYNNECKTLASLSMDNAEKFKYPDDVSRKAISSLRVKLRNITGIQDDPFKKKKKGELYETKFRIRISPEFSRALRELETPDRPKSLFEEALDD